MDIAELLSSRGRLKILMALLEHGELNISELARLSGLNHVITNKHVRALEEMGLVSEERLGRIRLVKLNSSRPEIKLLEELFKKWPSSEAHER